MSDLTDDVSTGLCCTECGCYFTQEHGYPVICKDCAETDKENGEELPLPIATNPELGE